MYASQKPSPKLLSETHVAHFSQSAERDDEVDDGDVGEALEIQPL